MSMRNDFEVKCGKKMEFAKYVYTITAVDIIDYLRREIVGTDVEFNYVFKRFRGINDAHSFVNLGLIFSKKSMVVEKRPEGCEYAYRMLEEFGQGITLNESIVNALKPYMYPEKMELAWNNPATRDKLMKLGVDEQAFAGIAKYKDIKLARGRSDKGDVDCFVVYIDPEMIIKEMMVPVNPNVKFEGEIESTSGDNNNIVFTVALKDSDMFGSIYGVSADTVFETLNNTK